MTRPKQYVKQGEALDAMNDLQAWLMATGQELEHRMAHVAGLVEQQTRAVYGTGRLKPAPAQATNAPGRERERQAS